MKFRNSAVALALIALLGLVPAHAQARIDVITTGWGWAVGMDSAPSGEIALVSYTRNQVAILNGATVVRTFDGFRRPVDAAFDQDGNLFIACMGRDLGESSIARIAAGSTTVDYAWRTGFTAASGVDFDSAGRLWVSDADGNALFREDSSGNLVEVPGTWPFVHEIRFDTQGNLYLPAMHQGTLYRRSPDGQVSVVASGLTSPSAVVPDDRGGVFLADRGQGAVFEISRDGDVRGIAGGLNNPHGLLLLRSTLYVATWDSQASILGIDVMEPPTAPETVVAAPADGSAQVQWSAPSFNGRSAQLSYSVTALPGGSKCTTTTLSCTVLGLTNRQSYTFTVTATNPAGTSDPSAPSAAVMPLIPGFQMWSVDEVLSVGSSATLRFAQGAAGVSIALTGSAKATMTADSAGFGSTTFTAAKAGVQKFTASYSVKVGKKTTKCTATTQLYVPSVSGPMLKIKQGKTGKFSMQFLPPGAAVSISLTDGRTISLTADSAGKASTTAVFNTRGAVNYTVTVSGVQVATGGLTIS